MTDSEFEQILARGRQLAEKHEWTQALKAFEEAIQLDPEGIDAWAERGKLLSRLDRIEESLESFDRILSLVSDDADAWYNRGLCLTKLGRMQEALEAFREAGRCGAGDGAENQIGVDLFGFFTRGEEPLEEAFGRVSENVYSSKKCGYVLDPEFRWDDGFQDRLQVREVSESVIEATSSRYPQCRLTIEAKVRVPCNYPAKELAADLAAELCAGGGEKRFYVFPNGLVPAYAVRTCSPDGNEVLTDIIVTDRFTYRLTGVATEGEGVKGFAERVPLNFHPQNDL